MKLFGLTGNIGCGKSSVAKLLAGHDRVIVFDCDRIAKEIMLQKQVKQVVVEIAGEEILATDNSIDWKRVARIVFSDTQKKIELENLVHPLVRESIAHEAESLPMDGIGIVESAIIYEHYWENAFDGVIVATCDEDEQMRRLTKLRQMEESDAKARINTQLPQRVKQRLADFVIPTHCSKTELLERVAVLYQQLKQH